MPPRHETIDDHEPRQPRLQIALTAGTALLVLATLPMTVQPGTSPIGGALVLVATLLIVGVYHAVPRVTWLPFVPAAAAGAGLLAVSGGAASPYRPLLLILLVGGATLPRGGDALAVASLVVATALSPLLYDPPDANELVTATIEVASWGIAAVLVRRVADHLRVARRRVATRTQLASAVLGSLPQQAAVVDETGRIVLTNLAWDRAHGLGSDDDQVATAEVDYAHVCHARRGAAATMATALIADLEAVLAGTRTTAVRELCWEVLAATPRWFTVRTTALPHGLGAVVTHEDISTLIEAERSRQTSLDRIRELDARTDALLQAVSHDVRTPLTIVTGVTDTLQRNHHRLSHTDIDSLLDGLARQTRRLTQLLSGLLTLSSGAARPTGEALSLERQPIDIHATIRTQLEQVEAAGHRLEGVPPAAPLVVTAVPWIVDTVLERLIDNAIRHTPPGSSIVVEAHVDTPGVLILRVTDDGPGIPPNDRDRIFLPFERGSLADPHDPGSGIGLAAAQEAARLHGGDVWLEPSDDGPGASFRVELHVDPA